MTEGPGPPPGSALARLEELRLEVEALVHRRDEMAVADLRIADVVIETTADSGPVPIIHLEDVPHPEDLLDSEPTLDLYDPPLGIRAARRRLREIERRTTKALWFTTLNFMLLVSAIIVITLNW